MADLHFGSLMVTSEWNYFSVMSVGSLLWSFFFCPTDFGAHVGSPFVVTLMT
jgi:hypothetical protein